jgi:hypothetical protein
LTNTLAEEANLQPQLGGQQDTVAFYPFLSPSLSTDYLPFNFNGTAIQQMNTGPTATHKSSIKNLIKG